MLRKILVCLTCCLLAASAAWAQQKIVKVQGREKPIIGVVKETPTGYEIETEFGTVTVDRKDVVSMEDYVSPLEEYRQRLAKLDPDDAEGHFDLGRWALDKDLLDSAKAEAERAVQLKPDVAKYGYLLDQVNRKIQSVRGEKPATKPGVEVKPGGTIEGPLTDYFVGEEDIYRIRLEELSSKDTTAVIEFRNRVLDRFIAKMAGREDFKDPQFYRTFLGYPRLEQARYILRKIDRNDLDIKRDIMIKSDPKFMVEFRSKIWPILGQNCAGMACHGGGDKPRGDLRLFPIAGPSVAADYTNFVILSTYVKDGHRLLDREYTQDSLVLQYGLPLEAAKFKHPGTIPTVFQNTKQTKYQNVYEWIDSLAGPPPPNYHLEYKAPLGMPLNLSGHMGIPLPQQTTRPASPDGSTPAPEAPSK